MASPSHQLDVLYEDNHLLVVNKPAMLPTMGVAEGRPSLLAIAKQYIRKRYQKPGKVYLGIVSRLDAPVTGAVVIARTSKAASRLSAALRDRQVEKTYMAAVSGVPEQLEATLEHYLRKDERHRRMHTTQEDTPQAQLARLRYRVCKSHQDVSLLEIQLETGRKHQIRVQLAKIGHPILGDRKYGSRADFSLGIALHAVTLKFTHPVRQEVLQFDVPLPVSWQQQRSVKSCLE